MTPEVSYVVGLLNYLETDPPDFSESYDLANGVRLTVLPGWVRSEELVLTALKEIVKPSLPRLGLLRNLKAMFGQGPNEELRRGVLQEPLGRDLVAEALGFGEGAGADRQCVGEIRSVQSARSAGRLRRAPHLESPAVRQAFRQGRYRPRRRPSRCDAAPRS